MSKTIPFYPGIAGLRGLAILLVMGYHFFDAHFFLDQSIQWDFNPLRFGWAGVDLFFVISGFLITSILIKSKNQEHGLVNFFKRRALRIFPLYYGFLAAFFLLPRLFNFNLSESWAQLSSKQSLFWFYLSDLWSFFYATWPGLSLSHFWSLAIEEKFYLVWPFVILGLSFRQISRLCVLLFVVPTIFRLGFLLIHENGVLVNYTFPLCRLEGLVTGSWLAVHNLQGLKFKKGSVTRIIYGGFFCYLLIYLLEGHLSPMSVTMQMIGFPTNALVGGSLLYSALFSHTKTYAFCNQSSLKKIGELSYALYIFHLPALSLIKKVFPMEKSGPVFATLIPFCSWLIFSVLIAFIVGRLWENPFLRLKEQF